MKFILDYSKWRAGSDGENSVGEGYTRLLNSEGYKCCLGQFSEQCGVPEENLLDVDDPEDLFKCNTLNSDGGELHYTLGEIPFTSIDNSTGVFRYRNNTVLSKKAMIINDDSKITTNQRIEELKELFEEHGHEIEVINLPTEEETP